MAGPLSTKRSGGLAADVYETVVIAHTHPVHESDTAVMAHIQYAVSAPHDGQAFTRLKRHTQPPVRSLTEAGDMMGVLQSAHRRREDRCGTRQSATGRGRARCDHLRASELGIATIHSMALHDRADGCRSIGANTIWPSNLRTKLCANRPIPADRDRILNDIGTAFHMLGLRSVARDAFLVLSATAQEQYMRWVATLSLMGIAAEEGSEPIFEQFETQPSAEQSCLRISKRNTTYD